MAPAQLHRSRDLVVLPAALLLAAAPAYAQDPALRASAPGATPLPSPVVVPLDADSLARHRHVPLPPPTPSAPLSCSGVPLADLLDGAGVLQAGTTGPSPPPRYVLAASEDGRRVLFSLAELDPSTGDTHAFVVDHCESHAGQSPRLALQLLTSDRGRSGRNLDHVASITVVTAP